MTYSVRDIIADPLSAYREFHSRIARDGVNASFPEFEPAVTTIINAVNSDRFSAVFESHPDLLLEKAELMTMLSHINLVFYYDDPTGTHPYEIPFSAPYPYRPTLEVIESGLRMLDKLNRLEPGNRAVPFYHFDRYAYHKFGIFGNPDVIIMPVSEELGFYDLVRVRSVPIGLLGVVPETIRVDRHWQSPLDFWYHDINHIRRMCEYFRLRIKQQGITGDATAIDQYYASMDQFLVNTIVPVITPDEHLLTESEVAVRRMVQALIFEVTHESAMTAEPQVIMQEILRPGGPQPFEHMVLDEPEHPEDMEKLRTPTGNIASGVSVVGADATKPTHVRYFFDRSLGLLATVYNKLNFGFYDDPDFPSDMVVPVKYRTVDCMIAAIHKIWELCGGTDLPTDDQLHQLITSRDGSYEKYVYKGVLMDETLEGNTTNTGTYATDPMPFRSVVKEVFHLGKKVILLMGYSALGYQNPDQVMGHVRRILSQYDPEEYLVCIGATSEGIGQAYDVAQELGFETIGVVSTLALTYTGHYSKNVDRVFIVNDYRWGGYKPGTQYPADTTRVFLDIADVVYAFGGGENTAALLDIGAIQYRDTKMYFIPAEMKHENAPKTDLLGPAAIVAKRLLLPQA